MLPDAVLLLHYFLWKVELNHAKLAKLENICIVWLMSVMSYSPLFASLVEFDSFIPGVGIKDIRAEKGLWEGSGWAIYNMRKVRQEGQNLDVELQQNRLQ